MTVNRAYVLLLFFVMGLALVSNQSAANSFQSSYYPEETRPSKIFAMSYTAHDAIWIQSDQELIDQAAAESWAGNGGKDTPFIITGYSFNQQTQPLRIWNTDLHWRFINNRIDGIGDDIQCGTWIDSVNNGAIIDCEFLNRDSGMVIINVNNFTISGNYVHNVAANGIEITNMATNLNITNNIVDDINNHGILVAGMTSGSILGNDISDCGNRGISVTSGFYFSECRNNTIANVGGEGIFIQMATNSEVSFNTISTGEDVGISLIGFNTCTLRNNTIDSIIGNGISVDYCEDSEISKNNIDNCTEIGIESLGGSNSSILRNTICDCGGYAVSLNEDTEFFEVKFNVFLSNGVSCQLDDNGENNSFIYNYFSDWLSPDANNDHFVDLSYEVEGTAGNSDDWPLTVIGYEPTPITSINTNSTTTDSITTPDSIMTFILVSGILGVIVLVAGVFVLKRR